MNKIANQYYLYVSKHESPIPWDIYDAKPPIEFALTSYFGQIFQKIEQSCLLSGLVFISPGVKLTNYHHTEAMLWFLFWEMNGIVYPSMLIKSERYLSV